MDLFASLLEVLVPTRCAGCDLPGQLLCDECARTLPYADPAWACPRCGAPFGYITCTECWNRETAFTRGICVGSLEPPLSRCVTLFKDAGERRLGDILGSLVATAAGEWSGWAQVVVPVPASAEAVRRRGFDHTALLASGVARRLEVPLLTPLACAGGRDQRTLGRIDRARNVSDTFVPRPGVVLPPRVLCIDDVMTTGSTLDAAAAALLSAGAEEVRVGAVARAW